MESEKNPFQFIRNKLNHKSFAVYRLCCLNNCKQNKLHWCNTTVVSFRATVWSRHATRSLSSRCVTRANKGYEGGYASMRDLIIGIWSQALLRPRMRSSGTWASERSVRALVLIISARFPANLSPTCLTMHTQSRPSGVGWDSPRTWKLKIDTCCWF